MNPQQFTNQMSDTETQLAGYTSDLPSQIKTEVNKAYSPAMKESLGVTQNQMSDYLGRFMETTGMGPGMSGTTARDLSPTQRMGVIGRELGTMGGQLNSSVGYTDYLGGQANDMYSQALQAAQLGQQSLADKYDRLGQQQALAYQLQEAEKDRALSRSLSGGSGGASTVYNLGNTETDNTSQLSPKQKIQSAISSISQLRKTSNIESNMNMYHSQIIDEAKKLGVNLNPEELWMMLGNDPSNVYKAVNPAAKYFDLTKLI